MSSGSDPLRVCCSSLLGIATRRCAELRRTTGADFSRCRNLIVSIPFVIAAITWPLASCSGLAAGGVTETGSLTIAVDSLPPGADAQITVSNGDGFQTALTHSATITSLLPGVYTITATDVRVGFDRYISLATSQSITVGPAGTAVTVHVGYLRVTPQTTGVLDIAVGGLPTDLAAEVTVTGPGGETTVVTTTQVLTGLAPGAYTIVAGAVTLGRTVYTPQDASQTSTVVAAATATASVMYSSRTLTMLSPGFQARSMVIPVDVTDGNTLTFDYQIYVPVGYTPDTAWPVIVASSGSGQFGVDNTSQLSVGLGPHISALGDRAVVVFPQWRNGTTTPNLRRLVEVTALMNAVAEVHADRNRLYAVGTSSGGFSVWENLYWNSTLFAAGVSAAGGINTAQTGPLATVVDALRAMPIWIFSADDDASVPTATYFTPIVNEWAALGIGDPPVRHTLYHAIGGHGPTWDTAFASAATWNWLFAQHR
jgi:hypothetical protein